MAETLSMPPSGFRRYEAPPGYAGGGPGSPEEETAADKARADMEARFGQAREEDYAKRDRVLNRVMGATEAKDVAAALEMVKDYENPHFGESIDRFTYGAEKRAAIEGQRTFEKGSRGELRLDLEKTKKFADKLTEESSKELETPLARRVREVDGSVICDLIEGQGTKDEKVIRSVEMGVTYELRNEGIISNDALIDSDGNLSKGKVRASGYAISVTQEGGGRKSRLTPATVQIVDETTGEKKGLPLHAEIGTEKPENPEVIIHFGTERERLALANAHEQLHRILVTAEVLQNQVALFDSMRANLEGMVKYFYQQQLFFTNEQTQWFFTAADIAEISSAKPENSILGDQRDKAMRLYHLVGMSETREKMEEHLSDTYNMEQILDYKKDEQGHGISSVTLDRVIDLAKIEDKARKGLGIDGLEKERDQMTPEEKFKIAVKFLIGKSAEMDDRGVWTLKEWYDRDRRDPTKAANSDEERGEKAANSDEERGEKAADDEAKNGFRGYLTEFGNPYIEDYRDRLYVLMNRFGKIVGNDMAVTEAGRYFWTRGERDESGMEIYSFKKALDANGQEVKNWKGEPVWIPNLPTGEDLVRTFNSSDFKQWENYCTGSENKDAVEKRYKIPGEPVASDLSKLFYPKMWRLKEMMKDRSAGPYLTYDKFDRLTQSMFSLIRLKVPVRKEKNKNNEEVDVFETRSVREAWMGFKGHGVETDEKPMDLGEIQWDQSAMPEEVRRELAGGGRRNVGRPKEKPRTSTKKSRNSN